LAAAVQEVILDQVQQEAIPYFQVLHQKVVAVDQAKQVLPEAVEVVEEMVMLELIQVEVVLQEFLVKAIEVVTLLLVV
jgi:hypothetical protein